MQLLKDTDRNTDSKIFDALEKLYGENVSTSQLRSLFFKCQQQTGEGVGPFILCLCESHSRWRNKEPATGSDDEMLRRQLVLGLVPGTVQTELQCWVRREPELTFEEACREAKAMEKETERAAAESINTRRTYNSPSQPAPPNKVDPLQDWSKLKEALRAELAEELRTQVTDLKTSLLAEIRTQQANRRQTACKAAQMGWPGPPDLSAMWSSGAHAAQLPAWRGCRLPQSVRGRTTRSCSYANCPCGREPRG